MSLPAKYKAAIYDAPGSISTKVVELEMPQPGAGEVLINLTHSGVCHSDLGVMTNSWKTLPFPTQAGQVGGHEGVGKIVRWALEQRTRQSRLEIAWESSGWREFARRVRLVERELMLRVSLV
jgi:D-arabinose 1-dehydrogenase-like Zn-dependent alcohol dehydrogenase